MMKWNSALYDNKHDFVAEYGKELLELLPDHRHLAVLDLGCGTATLTAQLAGQYDKVTGVDSSQEMLDKARAQFGNIEFRLCDALDLPFANEFDIVFSNAVFHWISDHDLLLKNVYRVLKPHGFLVCEFGAHGNIAAIEKAFAKACRELGYDYKSKFYFPKIETFGRRLKENGFVIDRIDDYDRPTVLKDCERGLANWIKQFFALEMEEMPAHT